MSTQRSVEDLTDELDAIHEGDARAPLLIELLGRTGHERHEDIVFERGVIGPPALFRRLHGRQLAHAPTLRNGGNLHEFQRKCAYALARIATSDARVALEQMAKSSAPICANTARKGWSTGRLRSGDVEATAALLSPTKRWRLDAYFGRKAPAPHSARDRNGRLASAAITVEKYRPVSPLLKEP